MSAPTPAIPRRRIGTTPAAPQIFEVLDCRKPLRPPARHSLAHVDEVVFLRSEERTALREGRVLTLGIPDPTLSARHARLRRIGDQFVLEDLGSTNGTFVNGERHRECPLADSDAIEMGHTELLFRAAMQEGTDLLRAPAPGLATIVPPLAAELERIPAIARSMVPVVIGGETGTGKEMIARAVHTLSQRRGAFVAVNCGAIAQNLLEAELFGYRKGAFSGALENRPGLVRAADGGTLLLDEIGDLPAASQAALLRVLQEGEVLAVGATEPVKVDVRVLAATHADLEALVTTGKFRADLLARIAGFTVRLPPLRWRREDLGLLIGSFLRKFGRDDASFTCEAGRALLGYRWPANIRELEKAIESALVLAGEGPIDVQHLPGLKEQIRGIVPRRYPAELSPEDERHRDELAGLLRQNHGNVAAVARAMGKARMQIHRWVRRYDLRLSDFR